MEKHPLYGKKKKKKSVVCVNPLFEKWLTEWRDAAAEKALKSQYTYGKALKTLKKFPLKLESGKDCKILENFGDKICKLLDDRLAEHVAQYGTTEPVPQDDDDLEIPHTHYTQLPASTNTHKTENAGGRLTGRCLHEMSDSNDSGGEELPRPPARKRARSGRGGEYVPTYRSGPYALLLTLYRHMQADTSHAYMTKSDLMRQAQPLADKSFTQADPGCRYTAWSSMGTLVKKGLVIKESSPARYSLTDAGCELAHRLETVQEPPDDDAVPFRIYDQPGQPQNQQPDGGAAAIPFRIYDQPEQPPYHQPTEGADTVPFRIYGPTDEIPQHQPTGVADHVIGSKRLQCWYVDENGCNILVKDRAVVTVDDELGVGFLVKCHYTQLIQSGLKYKLDMTRQMGDDYVYAYLNNTDTDDIAIPPSGSGNTLSPGNTWSPGNTSQSPSNASWSPSNASWSPRNTSQSPGNTLSPGKRRSPDHLKDGLHHSYQSKGHNAGQINSETVQLPPRVPALSVTGQTAKTAGGKDYVSCLDSHLPRTVSHEPNTTGKNNRKYNNTIQSSASPPTCESVGLFERLRKTQVNISSNSSQECEESSQNSLKSLTSVSSSESEQTVSRETNFVLRPGQFDIVLCVDNAEFYGASKGSSKTLLPELMKNGVECDLRKLHVGDLLWVAREKTNPRAGELERPAAYELVLHYVVERKRMDDLVGSCIDGRFKEQKFRLKKCGLQHPMYLIEDYGSMQHFSLPETTIKQAIVNTQVIDGFTVKRTTGCKETVAFLTVFTRYLQSTYKDKTLYACGLDEIKQGDNSSVNDSHQRLPTFDEFNKGSVKSKALTVQEMFGKQLIQLHGMSAEKAKAVVNIYPTPTHLFSAFTHCNSEREKESLLSSIKCGKSTRKLGQVQSKQIYQLYNTQTLIT